MPMYQPEIETMPQDQIRAHQSKLLVQQVRNVYDNVPYYRAKMEAKGITPDDIHGLEDLHKLPFLSKNDLREAYPYGLLARPLKDCVRIQSTSGTTGRRVVAFYTQHDLDLWEDCCARAIMAAGGTNEDVCHVCYGYGLFTGGPGLNGGSHKVGCLTLPISSGNTDRQIQFIVRPGGHHPVLHPLLRRLSWQRACIETGAAPDKIPLKAGIFGAEAWSRGDAPGHSEHNWAFKAYDIYGLTELSGPGVAYECTAQQRDAHSTRTTSSRRSSTLTPARCCPTAPRASWYSPPSPRKAFPLLRYRTRDICILNRDKCPCGRTHVKMCKPMGRSDDMLIIRGVNVFPSQIEDGAAQGQRRIHHRQLPDHRGPGEHPPTPWTCNVEMTREDVLPTISVGEVERRQKEMVDGLRSMLGLGPPRFTLVGSQVHRPQRGQGGARHRQPEDCKTRQNRLMLIKQISVFVENEPGKLVERHDPDFGRTTASI